jgi:hypothetical protein
VPQRLESAVQFDGRFAVTVPALGPLEAERRGRDFLDAPDGVDVAVFGGRAALPAGFVFAWVVEPEGGDAPF